MTNDDVIALSTATTAVVAVLGVAAAVLGAQGQRRAELMVSALTHFVGGSQQRSAGVAALTALRGRRGRGWRSYAPAIAQLFYLQLTYVMLHGSNRHEAHEVGNVVQMLDWLCQRDSDLWVQLVADKAKVESLLSSLKLWGAGAGTATAAPAGGEVGLADRIQVWQRILESAL